MSDVGLSGLVQSIGGMYRISPSEVHVILCVVMFWQQEMIDLQCQDVGCIVQTD